MAVQSAEILAQVGGNAEVQGLVHAAYDGLQALTLGHRIFGPARLSGLESLLPNSECAEKCGGESLEWCGADANRPLVHSNLVYAFLRQ